MLQRTICASLFFGILLLNGCTKKDQHVYDLIEKIDERLKKIEELIFPQQDDSMIQKEAYTVPVGDSPILGEKDAPLHIVLFSNFQCHYCALADQKLRELMKDIAKDDALKGKINLVFKHFPFEWHEHARAAAKASLAAAEQGKFWEYSELVFKNQSDMSQENFESWAKQLGLDVAAFKKALSENDAQYNKIIDADIELGEKSAQLKGTPWILLGGWLLDGDITIETVKRMIKDKNLL